MKKKRIFRFGFNGFGGWGPKEGGTLLAPGSKILEAIVSRFGV
jgi:hypothetical protein